MKQLSAGLYRYKYRVDGVDFLDPNASKTVYTLPKRKIVDEREESLNVLLVINPPVIPQINPPVIPPSDLPLQPLTPLLPDITNEKQIQHLNLNNYSLGDRGAWCLSSFLSSAYDSLLSLNLSFNSLTDRSLLQLATHIEKMPFLHSLYLNDNFLGLDSMTRFCECIGYVTQPFSFSFPFFKCCFHTVYSIISRC